MVRLDFLQRRQILSALRHCILATRVERATGRRMQRARNIALEYDPFAYHRRIRHRGRRQQSSRVGMQRPLVEFFSRGDLDDTTEVHHAHPVAYMLHDAQVVGDKQIGETKLLLQIMEQIDNLRAWLYRVAHNLAIDALRRRKLQENAVSEWVYTKPSETSPSAEQSSINRQAVERALSLLNDRERSCLLLRAEGLSYAEIGQVLEISAKSVSVYLARGVKKVRSET